MSVEIYLKDGFKKPYVGESGKDGLEMGICQTLGKTLLCTFIVQVSLEAEL